MTWDDGPIRHKTQPQTVIAGLTRNLLSERVSSSRSGDGGCSSAMTVKGVRIVNPSLVSRSLLSKNIRINQTTNQQNISLTIKD